MTREQIAERLKRAELELRAALEEHDGTGRSVVRYQAARAEHLAATRIARAICKQTVEG